VSGETSHRAVRAWPDRSVYHLPTWAFSVGPAPITDVWDLPTRSPSPGGVWAVVGRTHGRHLAADQPRPGTRPRAGGRSAPRSFGPERVGADPRFTFSRLVPPSVTVLDTLPHLSWFAVDRLGDRHHSTGTRSRYTCTPANHADRGGSAHFRDTVPHLRPGFATQAARWHQASTAVTTTRRPTRSLTTGATPRIGTEIRTAPDQRSSPTTPQVVRLGQRLVTVPVCPPAVPWRDGGRPSPRWRRRSAGERPGTGHISQAGGGGGCGGSVDPAGVRPSPRPCGGGTPHCPPPGAAAGGPPDPPHRGASGLPAPTRGANGCERVRNATVRRVGDDPGSNLLSPARGGPGGGAAGANSADRGRRRQHGQ